MVYAWKELVDVKQLLSEIPGISRILLGTLREFLVLRATRCGLHEFTWYYLVILQFYSGLILPGFTQALISTSQGIFKYSSRSMTI